MKMKFVKAVSCSDKEPRDYITIGKVYDLHYDLNGYYAECIINDLGEACSIVTENYHSNCCHLGNDTWKFCDKDGNLIGATK